MDLYLYCLVFEKEIIFFTALRSKTLFLAADKQANRELAMKLQLATEIRKLNEHTINQWINATYIAILLPLIHI